MDAQFKAKVTNKFDYSSSRPTSPTKEYHTSLSPPPFTRPKAKINSSAAVPPRKLHASASANGLASTRANAAAVARAPSPFKLSSVRNAQPSSASAIVKAKLTAAARPISAVPPSTPTLPESRQRALTATPSDLSVPSRVKTRRGSGSSFVSSVVSPQGSVPSPSAVSPRSAAASPPSLRRNGSPAPESRNATSPSSVGTNGRGLVRIKSKVSRLADTGHHTPNSLPSSPNPSRLTHKPARVPSISGLSLSPLLPSQTDYNYTDTISPTSAAPHPHNRFPTAREVHSQRPHLFQTIPSSNDDLTVTYTYSLPAAAKVDPAAVPLPPQSPPTSTLSFSSRSSVSRSSLSLETRSSEFSRSTAPAPSPKINGNVNGNASPSLGPSLARKGRLSMPGASLDGLGIRIEPEVRESSSPGNENESADEDDVDDGPEDSDRKMKAAAKSIRKIADLEITNRSLLAINSSLEATKHRQAKEIRDLRRKLRESRLILPPPAYRAVKSSLTHDDTASDADADAASDDDEEDADEEAEAEAQAAVEGRTDEAYRRVRSMIESLLEAGKQALERKPEDFAPGGLKSGAKVLSEEEARTWRGEDDADARSVLEPEREDAASVSSRLGADVGSRPLTPSRVAVPDSDDGLGSEDEVEASLSEPEVAPPAPSPPNITVTPSP